MAHVPAGRSHSRARGKFSGWPTSPPGLAQEKFVGMPWTSGRCGRQRFVSSAWAPLSSVQNPQGSIAEPQGEGTCGNWVRSYFRPYFQGQLFPGCMDSKCIFVGPPGPHPGFATSTSRFGAWTSMASSASWGDSGA